MSTMGATPPAATKNGRLAGSAPQQCMRAATAAWPGAGDWRGGVPTLGWGGSDPRPPVQKMSFLGVCFGRCIKKSVAKMPQRFFPGFWTSSPRGLKGWVVWTPAQTNAYSLTPGNHQRQQMFNGMAAVSRRLPGIFRSSTSSRATRGSMIPRHPSAGRSDV